MTETSKPIVTMFYSVEHHPGMTDSGAILRYVGGNTGNLLFRYALQERIIDRSNCQILHLPSTLDLFQRLENTTCRQVLSSSLAIYPVANLLRPIQDFEANPAVQAETELVTHLSQLFPGSFLVMGLGYQSQLRLSGAPHVTFIRCKLRCWMFCCNARLGSLCGAIPPWRCCVSRRCFVMPGWRLWAAPA